MISEADFYKLSDEQKYMLCVNRCGKGSGALASRPRCGAHTLKNGMRALNAPTLQGEGFLDPMIKNDYTAAVKDVINKYGNETITKITIVRTPLSKVLTMALNAVSFGDFAKTQKQNKYDDYFHLNLNVVLSSGQTLTVEKSEVINVAKGGTVNKDSDVLEVENIPQNTTLFDFLNRAKQQQGSKYFAYSANNNTCQHFVRDVLLGNGINGANYIEFVKQDTESIFKNRPIFRKIANTATDLGAAAHTVMDAIVPVIMPPSLPSKKRVRKGMRSIKKFFGGAEVTDIDYSKLKVKELKEIIKSRKREFKNKANVGGLNKKQLLALLEELI